MREKNVSTKKLYKFWGIFVLVTLGVWLSLESSLMPFTRDGYISTDTSVWIQIAKEMVDGKMVYRDLFDHKGPVLFILFSLFFRVGGITGIWVLQCIFLGISIWMCFKCTEKLTSHLMVRIYATAITIFGLSIFGSGEDFSVEEICLPFMFISLFIFISYFCDVQKTIKKINIFILGGCAGTVFFLRQNQIALWVAFVIIVFVQNLYMKRYKELLWCAVCFAMGMVAVWGMVLFWLQNNGALSAWWEDVFEFNFLYSGNSELLTQIEVFFDFLFNPIQCVCVCINIYLLFFGKKGRELYCANLIYIFLNLIFMSMSGRGYGHYKVTLIPGFLLPLTIGGSLLWDYLEMIKKRWIHIEPFWIISIILFLTFGRDGVEGLKRIADNIQVSDMEKENLTMLEYIEHNTLQEDEIVVIGNSSYIYLGSKRNSATEFLYTSTICELSKEKQKKFLTQLKCENPVVIVVPKDFFAEQIDYKRDIYSLLERDYIYVLDVELFDVYKRK